VPVVPVGLVGTTQVQRPGSNRPHPFKRVTVRFGPPLDLSRWDAEAAADPMMLRLVTDELMFEIRALSGQEYVDRYAKRHGVVGGAEVAQVRASSNGDGHGIGNGHAPVPPMPPRPATASSEPAA
jgi:1-acyl-sn-glycerol-3-phosphate acyltransferase